VANTRACPTGILPIDENDNNDNNIYYDIFFPVTRLPKLYKSDGLTAVYRNTGPPIVDVFLRATYLPIKLLYAYTYLVQ